MDYYKAIKSNNWTYNNPSINFHWTLSSTSNGHNNIFIYYHDYAICKKCYNKKTLQN